MVITHIILTLMHLWMPRCTIKGSVNFRECFKIIFLSVILLFFSFELLLSCTPWSSLLCSVSKFSSILLKKCIRNMCLEYPLEVLFAKGFSLLVVNLVVKIIKMEAKWTFSWNNVSLLLPADQFFLQGGPWDIRYLPLNLQRPVPRLVTYHSKPHCMAIYFFGSSIFYLNTDSNPRLLYLTPRSNL